MWAFLARLTGTFQGPATMSAAPAAAPQTPPSKGSRSRSPPLHRPRSPPLDRSRSPPCRSRSSPQKHTSQDEEQPAAAELTFTGQRRSSTGGTRRSSTSGNQRGSLGGRTLARRSTSTGGFGGARRTSTGSASGGLRRSVGGVALASTRRRSLAAASRRSFPHCDFDNPEAETCWLSCFFQALWHSVVFHSAFEADLLPAKYTPKPEEIRLAALQRAWAEYEAAERDQQGALSGSASLAGTSSEDALGSRLVPAEDLVDGFGEGYGDMSEALAELQQELSESSNPAAVRIGELLVLVPPGNPEGTLPTPAMAWRQAEEWQMTNSALIAVDISVPPLERECIKELAESWVPLSAEMAATHKQESVEKATTGTEGATDGFGSRYRLVALVCFQYHLLHYVAFCRRQRDPSRCMFFNDLPELTQGAPKETEWLKVPEMCSQHMLTPRLALYECKAAAAAASLRQG
mmetsp:Transcript_127418/g.231640  ORF Transcript_127418/g.231640 Transcript_127418/m.231640 type:complete len:462 (+) Transcript_127418:81-1466(+)